MRKLVSFLAVGVVSTACGGPDTGKTGPQASLEPDASSTATTSSSLSTLGDLYLSPAPGSKGPCLPGADAWYPGQNVNVTGVEFAPGSTVALTYDDGTTITSAGSASVGSDGSFTAQLTVPSSATIGGLAEFKATGSDINGGGRYALDVFSIVPAGAGCSDRTPPT